MGHKLSSFNPKLVQENAYDYSSGGAVRDPKPQQNQAPALGSPVPGKKEGVGRTRLRFVGCRIRLLDPDNFAGSTKDLIDGLVKSGLVRDDSVEHIILETEQVKVAHKKEQRTEIVITYP